jgi:hypothetical protein
LTLDDFEGETVQPILTFTDRQQSHLVDLLELMTTNPYTNYQGFQTEITELVAGAGVPAFLVETCHRISEERRTGVAEAHVLRNCPVDREIPLLGNDDPAQDKQNLKKTFVAEAFLALFARLTATPLLAYAARFNGAFFTDVIAINRFAGQQTGYAEGEVVFHNDRTAHPVRADFITLLGMRCPEEELVYTGFVAGRALLAQLSPEDEQTLREPLFVTPFDVLSRERTPDLDRSQVHPILSGEFDIRYLDTHTTVAQRAPVRAKDALLALKNALVRADRHRHRLLAGDVLTFANQQGLHNRERIEITDPDRARTRWLLKTYAFRDQSTSDRHKNIWVDGVPGKVGD